MEKQLSILLLKYLLLFHLYFENQSTVKAAPNEDVTHVSELQNVNEDCPAFSDRMSKMEDKNDEKQEKQIEIMKNNTIAEDKNNINSLTNRVSLLESSLAKIKTIDKVFGHPKRPVRLLPPHILRGKEKENSGEEKVIANRFLGPPTNCTDLGKLGYTLNGFYLVNGIKDKLGKGKVKVVYCRFQQPQNSNWSMESSIGNIEVKTKSVHFHVLRNTSFSANQTIVPFEIERFNVGGAMDLKSGIFTAPLSGTYYFQFNGLKYGDNPCLGVYLDLNAGHVHYSFIGNASFFLPISFGPSLQLKVGDKVKVRKGNCGALHDNRGQFTHFSGWLVEEDLALV